ncbi:Golgi membrane protein 1 isoform X2 [Salarias fasciatus]|uniref:Golgi membrane protein 1 isoform X2 n=1 Tax=Salarias fasciatus TaxID=181472 RepID=UPI001176BFA2|nr:Golgi membrane protein 1 isoform X2 [Salarias fasciatus]
MGGLGNGRRVGRSPSLMIAALVACILVLGFNYWVSSSRNLELQTKLYELEGQVRRGSAERVAAELKRTEFEDELSKQKEQIIHIENVYQRKLEDSEDACNQVKGTLQQNISSSTTTIQQLKDQLNQLNDDLERFQNELQNCQEHMDNLNSRLTNDINQCHSQLQAQKEQCDQRVAEAKLEVQKNMERILLNPAAQQKKEALQQENTAEKKDAEPTKNLPDGGNSSVVVINTPAPLDQKANTAAAVPSNDNKDASEDLGPVKDLDKAEVKTVAAKAVEQDGLQPQEGAPETEETETEGGELEDNNLPGNKEMEMIDGRAEEDADTEEDDPGMEGLMIQGKAVETEGDGKVEEPEEYDADESVVGGADLEKQQQQINDAEKAEKEMEAEAADYNGDEENEGEFEADKQAQLAEI